MHILVAMDRSEESRNALENALGILETLAGELTIIHVHDGDRNATIIEDMPMIARAESRASELQIPFQTVIRSGTPVSEIVSYAEANDVNAIYVGHRGLARNESDFGGESRGPLGSVARGLVEHTNIPVTVFDRGL